ncbi:MAG: hypothetical protein ACPG5T_06870, partial [Endozoicomonas sp.]
SLDLYRENFQPSMSCEERRQYMVKDNTAHVERYVHHVKWADAPDSQLTPADDEAVPESLHKVPEYPVVGALQHGKSHRIKAQPVSGKSPPPHS